MTRRSSARLLAPIALVTSFIALFVVVTSGGSDGETDQGPKATRTESSQKPKTTTTKRPEKVRRTYIVKPGDTPSGIADSVGISLDTLLELNPDVAPQLLSPGQRLKLSP